jgi:DNA-directed RNA polymerase specialized sigma24 family protein
MHYGAVVARICLNVLRSRRTRGEQPLGGLRPEPIIDDPAVGTDPEHEALLADTVALQVVLDTLSPAERLAFVLHDTFAVPFDEIAGMVDRSPQATRQLASRARRRVQGAAPAPDPRPDAPAGRRRRLLRRRARGRPWRVGRGPQPGR